MGQAEVAAWEILVLVCIDKSFRGRVVKITVSWLGVASDPQYGYGVPEGDGARVKEPHDGIPVL